MCYTYDKSKGGDTRELQSRMVPPPPPKKKTGLSHLNRSLTSIVYANVQDIFSLFPAMFFVQKRYICF